QDDGSGRSPAVILLPDRGLVQEDERWAGETDVAGRANATKDVDELVERLEGRDEVQDQHGDGRVAQEREGDRPERSPARLAAIDVAGFVDGLVDLLQAGDEDDHIEPDLEPESHGDEHEPVPGRAR